MCPSVIVVYCSVSNDRSPTDKGRLLQKHTYKCVHDTIENNSCMKRQNVTSLDTADK